MHPILALYRRNAWATERLLDFCQGQPEVAAPAEPDLYGGIEPMFNHILAAEAGYLRLLTGELHEDRVAESQPRSLADLGEPARWLALRWPVALEGDRDPEPVLPYQRGKDAEWMSDWVPLVQCVHHGDDHRAQVATQLSRGGVEPPWLDGWAFGEEEHPTAGTDPEWWTTLLGRFFGHHLWATERLLEHCRCLSPEQLSLSAPGTYGPLGATLNHLASADRTYHSRLTIGRPSTPLEGEGPDALLEHVRRLREGWPAYLQSSPDFEVMVERRDGVSPAWAVVLQAIHHGNDHRTHAGTVLLGHHLDPPDLDAWAYAWSEGALKPIG